MWSNLLSIAAALLAAFFVVLEEWKGNKRLKFQSWRFWLALMFLLVSVVSTSVDSLTSREYEREREADLKLIQKQNSGLHSICFEIQAKPPNPDYRRGSSIQIHTWLPVADLHTTGLFAEYIHIFFSPDSGWYRASEAIDGWPYTAPHLGTGCCNRVNWG